MSIESQVPGARVPGAGIIAINHQPSHIEFMEVPLDCNGVMITSLPHYISPSQDNGIRKDRR